MNALQKLIESNYNDAMSYGEYREEIIQLHHKGKTTGPNQSEQLLAYSKLNLHRMRRLDRTIDLTPDAKQALSGIQGKLTWLVITEAWCGDAAQNLPVINAMAEQALNLDLKIILRDENPEIMDLFLTNGGRSIPKLICLDAGGSIQFTWGPRPEELQKMVANYKLQPEPKETYDEFLVEVQKWYADDKTLSTQKELADLLEESVTVDLAENGDNF